MSKKSEYFINDPTASWIIIPYNYLSRFFEDKKLTTITTKQLNEDIELYKYINMLAISLNVIFEISLFLISQKREKEFIDSVISIPSDLLNQLFISIDKSLRSSSASGFADTMLYGTFKSDSEKGQLARKRIEHTRLISLLLDYRYLFNQFLEHSDYPIRWKNPSSITAIEWDKEHYPIILGIMHPYESNEEAAKHDVWEFYTYQPVEEPYQDSKQQRVSITMHSSFPISIKRDYIFEIMEKFS